MASLLSLSSLLGQTSIDDHEQVLKAANTVLNKTKNDVEAQHVKLVALLKLDRFDDALHVLQTGGQPLKERARLEWAYALYKAGQPAKAAEIAHQNGQDHHDRGMRHVEAQASYRNEDFERANTLYSFLAASGTTDVANEDVDLRINNSAVNAQLEWAGRGHLVKNKKPGREDLDAFETAYNAACGSIARDELGQAEILLRRAKDLCNALQDLSDEEKRTEMMPITVQQIYVLIRQARLQEATDLAATISINDITESSTKHIAQTNTTAASPELANPYLSHRIIHKAPATIKPDQPFAYQSAAISRNNYALDLLSQKYSGIIESATSAVSKHPSPTLDPNVNSLAALAAAAHARNQVGKDALKAVLPVLEKRPTDIGLILAVIQLYVLNGNHGAAITLLEAFFARLSRSGNPSDVDVRYAPGLVATMTSLYSARGQTSHVRSELANAARHWRQRSKDSSSAPSISPRSLNHLYKTAATALIESSSPEDQTLASVIFTELHEQDLGDRYATVGMVAAIATKQPHDQDKEVFTDAQLTALTPVVGLISGIDVSALEKAGVAKPVIAVAPVSKKRTAADTPSTPAPKKARKIRPSKMPKNFDANKTVDPERWLPMRDRSYYRPPKGGNKKAKARQAMLTQGGVVDESRDSSLSRPDTPSVVEAKAAGGSKNKKKKGKGGKW